MRRRNRHAAKRHILQASLAAALGNRKVIATGAICAGVLVSGAAYGALYGFGPAETWTIGMITAMTSAVSAQLAAFQALFMAQSQLRFEQVISAVAIATKQESVSANQVVDATRNSGQTLVNAVRAQRINDATVKAYLDYSPTTGQGFDACGTVARNQSLDKAFDDVPGLARQTLAQLDVAPGRLVDSRVGAMSNRLNLHRTKFCTPAEANAGLCSVGSVPGGDTNAALLFTGVDQGSDAAAARKAFIQNVVGAPDERITRDAGQSPAGQAYAFEKNRKDSLLSIPAYSLAMIDANNTRSEAYGGKSANEMMKLRVNQYFGGKEAQQWSSSMAAQTTRGLIVELTKMSGLEVWMRHKQYEQGQRMEANLAAFVLSSTDDMQAEVDQKYDAVLRQTAAQAVRP
jgi:hypothetical protein